MTALELIEKEKKERTGKLFLNGCGLTELPEELFKLDWLEVLVVSEQLNPKIIGHFNEYQRPKGSHNKIKTINPKIQQLVNLKTLALGSGNKQQRWPLSDISSLGQLTSLEKLDLSGNKIEDISSLKKLQNLYTLGLRGNSIADTSSLGNLVNLNTLDLGYNSISQMTGIEELPLLNTLYLDRNRIKIPLEIDGMPTLCNLYLGKNQIKEFPLQLAKAIMVKKEKESFFLKIEDNPFGKKENGRDEYTKDKNATSLLLEEYREILKKDLIYDFIKKEKEEKTKKLDIGCLGLEELPQELFELEWLEELIISTNYYDRKNQIVYSQNKNINTLTGKGRNKLDYIPNEIKKLKKLKTLIIGGMYPDKNWKISDISPLTELTSLVYLDIKHCEIECIENIGNLTNLTFLSIYGNKVSNIQEIGKLRKLVNLHMGGNPISDLSPLESLLRLKYLFLHNSPIVNLYPIGKLPKLKVIRLHGCPNINLTTIGSPPSLTHLHLWHNKIDNLLPLSSITSLTHLHLYGNVIVDLLPLSTLVSLKFLDLGNNKVRSLEGLGHLSNLLELQLTSNPVSEFSDLESLSKLRKLDLSHCEIVQFPVTLAKAIQNMDFLELNIQSNPFITETEGLIKGDYSGQDNFHIFINDYKNIILPRQKNMAAYLIEKEKNDKTGQLDIGNCGLKGWPKELFELTWLEQLTLGEGILNFEEKIEIKSKNYGLPNILQSIPKEISNLKKLKKLDLGAKNGILSDVSNLNRLSELIYLDLSGHQIENIDSLSLEKLIVLNLENNILEDIESLKKLRSLQYLFLGKNQLTEVSVFKEFINLLYLDLSGNKLSTSPDVNKLKNLTVLGLADNQIEVFPTSLAEKIHKKTEFHLQIDQNSFIANTEGMAIESYPAETNHFEAFKNDYWNLFFKKDKKETITLPAKLILLGNSNVGKTCLSHFLVNDNLNPKNQESTEILEIHNWKVGSNQNAFIYDFGGQDFYHATYQMFLTQSSFYLVLWDKETNKNNYQERITNERPDPYFEFNLNYWLGNIRYIHELQGSKREQDDIFIVENKIDLKNGSNNIPDSQKMQQFGVQEQLRISLKKQVANEEIYALHRKLLRAKVINKMQMLSSERKLVAKQTFVIRRFLSHIGKEIEVPQLFMTSEEFKAKFDERGDCSYQDIIQALSILHGRGLVLYYRKENKEESPIIWLYPDKVLERVHEVLIEQFKPNNQLQKTSPEHLLSNDPMEDYFFLEDDHYSLLPSTEEKKIYISQKEQGKLTEADIHEINQKAPNLTDLMQAQQIMFYDKYTENDAMYIVPQFLANRSSDPLFQMAQFGLHNGFSVKFKDFMPYGLFGRLMCGFGRLPEKKYYAKNEMIFTIKNLVKVWMSVDLVNLRLNFKVGSRKTKDFGHFYKYLFHSLLDAYYRKPILKYEEYKKKSAEPRIPEDLQLSLDSEHFALYSEIDAASNNPSILQLDLLNSKEEKSQISAFKFNDFMEKPKPKPLKVFISYAPEDLVFWQGLEPYLSPLARKKRIEIWHEGRILAGEPIDKRIKEQLDQADLVILLVSQHFLASSHIWEVELKMAMERMNEGKTRVIPFIVRHCTWRQWEVLPDDVMDEINKELEERDFTQFQFLPRENGEILPLNKWPNKEDAYVQLADEILLLTLKSNK